MTRIRLDAKITGNYSSPLAEKFVAIMLESLSVAMP
jgi:hypothetical protein